MQPTRWEILQLLKRRGRATVDELAKALGMTLMGVRLHLVVVERDGYVRRGTLRQKPGRPALVYSLTPKAEEIFPKRYDLLAEKLLEAIDGNGVADLERVLENAARSMAGPLASRLEEGSLDQRVVEVARALDENGGFASWDEADGGYLIHQHNCLFYRVARHDRRICAIDGVILREMLGVEVHQQECLLDGGARCSHFIPKAEDEGTQPPRHQDTKTRKGSL